MWGRARAQGGRPPSAPLTCADAQILQRLAGDSVRPSVGAVTQTRVTGALATDSVGGAVASAPIKAARAAIEARASGVAHKIARIASAQMNVLLRGCHFYVCNMPARYAHTRVHSAPKKSFLHDNTPTLYEPIVPDHEIGAETPDPWPRDRRPTAPLRPRGSSAC